MPDDKTPWWYRQALDAVSETGSVEVLGANIHYETWGRDGPGIALVHGSSGHVEWWRFVAPFLADRFRVVALDLSGNGDSGWRDRYSGAGFAEETWQVCQVAGLPERPFVVGHSFGGFVALETGHCFGDRLGGVVLVDYTVTRPEDHVEWGGKADSAGYTRRRTRVYEDHEAAVGRFRLLPDQPVRYPEVLEHVARRSLRQVEGGWTWKFDPALYEHLVLGDEQRDKFVGLSCRSALVVGECSEDIGAYGADYMRGITAGRLPVITIPRTHHHLMFEEPLALAMSIQGIVQAWVAEDGREEMADALARAVG